VNLPMGLGAATLFLIRCATVPVTPRTFDLQAPPVGDALALPAKVTDTTGAVVIAAFVEVNAPEGVVNPPGRPEAVTVSWTGGLCDRAYDVLIERVGQGLRVSIRTTAGQVCRLLGIGRALEVMFSVAMPANAVELRLLRQTGPAGLGQLSRQDQPVVKSANWAVRSPEVRAG